MDKNTILGFILIIAVLIGFSFFNRPNEEELKQRQAQETLSEIRTGEQKKDLDKDLLTSKKDDNIDSVFLSNTKSSTIYLQNKDITIGINSKGGEIGQAVLKNYKNQEKSLWNCTIVKTPA